MGAVDQETSLHGGGNDVLARYGQLNADHKAVTANLGDKGKGKRHFSQTFPKINTQPIDRRKQLIQDIEKLERHAATESASAEGGAVHARSDAGGRPLVRADHAQR